MAFLFETRTLASIASSPEAVPTSAMTTPSPTPYPSDILTDVEFTRSDRSLDLSFDNSSSALQEVGLNLALQSATSSFKLSFNSP